MTAKKEIIHATERLPADRTIEDAMERFVFRVKVVKGLKQADKEESVSLLEFREGCPSG